MIPAARMNRSQLLAALHELGRRLAAREIEAHLYVVGGAAITFAYHADRTTRDIDAVVAPRAEVFAAAREVTASMGLPEEWLNDSAAAFLPDVSVEDGPVVLDIPGLVVRSAPAEVVLAMKLLSARPAQDGPDVTFLASVLGLQTAAEVREVFLRYYPKGHLVEHSEMLIDALFPI